MEFYAKDWSDWIAAMPLAKVAFLFFCRKESILSTAMVARLAIAGIKAANPLLALCGYEGGVTFKNLLTKPLLVQSRAEELHTCLVKLMILRKVSTPSMPKPCSLQSLL